ncbi:protein mono-ADP-ribosyltransferase PARP9 [Polymixia lowei]
MASILDIHGDSVSIVRRCGATLKNVLQSKFGCTVDFRGIASDHGVGQPRNPTVVPQERFSVQLPNSLKVSVFKADLTNFKVDAVVNAANGQLNHGAGLAFALCKAGGPEIQIQSNKYITKKGELQTGDAIVTPAGRLPCQVIIHAVGPHLLMNPSKTEVSKNSPLLAMAVQNILERADENKLQSVAIPALSSGLFNFPRAECADIIVTTVKQYHDNRHHQRSSLCEVLLVNNDEPTVSEMERACRHILGHKSLSYSQAAGRHGNGATKASTCTVTMENVTLTLKKGCIENEQTDVIVNTTSTDYDLSLGVISKAILNKAGYKMQDEMNQYKKSTSGPVIVTKPYNLQCKQVYHAVCASKSDKRAEQILFIAISECLRLAAAHSQRSIAFPAIGTGNLGFSKTEVSHIMTEAVAEFAKKNKTRMDIFFVIYPSEVHTFKAFEDEMKSRQNRPFHPGSSYGSEHNNDFHGSELPTPQIRLSGSSAEATHEARRWLKDLFNSSDRVTVRNNFIQYFGEEQFQQLFSENKRGVSIAESFEKGCAEMIIQGKSAEDVVVAVLRVEDMLCETQKEFVREEELTMPLSVSCKRNPVDRFTDEFTDRMTHGLQIIRVEKVENPALKELFEQRKKRLRSSVQPKQMYQRIPAQFCDMVSHVGFQREYTPPDDPQYGDGIYFAATMDKAMEVWKNMAGEEYLYFVKAQVLTGKSTPGTPGLIMPPSVDNDPLVLYDSLSGGKDISVIFNGYQALPEYIIICKKQRR